MVQLGGGATVVAMMRLLRKGQAENVMRSSGEYLPASARGAVRGAQLASLGTRFRHPRGPCELAKAHGGHGCRPASVAHAPHRLVLPMSAADSIGRNPLCRRDIRDPHAPDGARATGTILAFFSRRSIRHPMF